MQIFSTFGANFQVNQFNRTGDSLASGMGYNILIWRAPSDQDAVIRAAKEEARSKQGRAIPLPHSRRTSERNGTRGVKRKRPLKDNGDLKKKKMKTIVGHQPQRRRKPDKL